MHSHICMYFFQIQGCLCCFTLQVLPSTQVNNLFKASSKEKITTLDISVASLVCQALRVPPEPGEPQDHTDALVFQEEMAEMAGREKKVKKGVQVLNICII